MTLLERLQALYAWLGRVGIVFIVACMIGWLPIGDWQILFRLIAIVTGIWLLARGIKRSTRQAIWRLRNRLLVTYTFIALVPLLLIIAMVAVSGYAIMSQLVLYLATTELDHRIELLTSTAETLRYMEPARREASVERMFDVYYKERFQGIAVVVREGDTVITYPKDLTIQAPPKGWGDVSGVVLDGGSLFGWAHRITPTGDITVTAPFSPEYLASLLPKLGVFDLVPFDVDEDSSRSPQKAKASRRRGFRTPARLLPSVNSLDTELTWYGSVPIYEWDKPSEKAPSKAILQIHSRPSMIFDVLFSEKTTEATRDLLTGIQIAVAILFLIVEIIALVIGVGMTRTVTSAVHELYEGTERVKVGDFTHRIPIKGTDQLAELGSSFNRMTENVQRLLAVSKEKERLQSEIEIAREVQGQLYPKSIPACPSLRLKAYNQPARMVSGDYFDYDGLPNHYVSFALGDVAGKGISAALLMAALQSSVRAGWSHAAERAHTDGCPPMSTSKLVSEVNVQLYKNTSPEKYATFFLGLYDPAQSMLSYTNAGHLPPLLFRKGEVIRLEIDGTVVGAFPFSEYGESKQKLEKGDLLVCYTDGISEPENAYGEMYGEERLIEVVQKNIHLSDDLLVEAIMDSVFQWTGSPELQDDMTLLLAWQQ